MKRRQVTITVSDHAVLRWLEREHGLDVEGVRRHLAGIVQGAAELGAVSLCVGQVRLVLRDSIADRVALVTALPRDVVFVPHDPDRSDD